MYPEVFARGLGQTQPPHKCTAASAQGIARQIHPDWRYSHSMPPGTRIEGEVRQHDVVTPMGPKRIDAKYVGEHTMVLQCPYTGELFLFERTR